MIQAGVRWNSVSAAHSGAMLGTIWMPLAPVPMTPTRFPASATSWRQRAE